jgi:exopolysaccharide biosynthesis polyprenyl glycosylphosphotransferase
MNEARRQFLLLSLKVFDMGLLVGSFLFATAFTVYLHHGPSLREVLSLRVKVGNFAIFLVVVLAWHLIFAVAGMYGSKRLASNRSVAFDAVKAVTLCTLGLELATALFSISIVSPRLLLIFWSVSIVLVASGRLLLRQFLGVVRKRGQNLRYMLILGTNPRAVAFARSIESRPELGFRILGFVDDDWPQIGEFQKSGRELACRFSELPEYLRHNVVDEIANYLPLRSFYEHSSQVASLCEQHGMLLRFNSDIFGLKTGHSGGGEFNGSHYITYYSGVRDPWSLLAKRTVDVVISSILLVLLSPLLVAAAILIKWTTNGPVFFLQERIGYNKRRFLIYKFRTMVPDAEKLMHELEELNEAAGPVFKIKNDPRITPVGKFLRRASIDELPQLINVLNGDMSLVGPRPLPMRDYAGFNEDWQRRRFSTRPGITCLWQVSGRCAITFEQWMKLDMQYLDEWSLWLDLKILARTIPAVLKGSGAA